MSAEQILNVQEIYIISASHLCLQKQTLAKYFTVAK